MKWGSFFVYLFFLAFLSAIIFKLYLLQVKQGEYYLAFSLGLAQKEKINSILRGKIFCRGEEVLAETQNVISLVAFPQKIEEKENTIKKLSQILNLEKKFLEEKLSQKNYVVLKEGLEEREIEEVKNLKEKNIFLIKTTKRVYPQGNLASNILGFLDKDGQGRYGVEEYFDEDLKKGKNLTLSIDCNLQKEAERILRENQNVFKYQSGEIIIMNPHNGEILTMAQYPNFDPNFYFKERDFSIFKNKATQELFEPGSVFKSVIFSVGLEENKITPETTYYDQGYVQIGGWRIENFHQKSYGTQTMTNVLEKSINTGAVFVEQLVGKEKFLEYLEKFGFFEKTGIELPEIFSQNNELKKGYEVNFATASFGQGISVTSIQLARFYATIFNGGKLIRPTIILNSKGEEKQVLSQKTIEDLKKMLISVVENGYGKRTKVEGYFVGGKTGTAQIPLSQLGIRKKGYSEMTIQTFVSFFPGNSQYLILVKLENPITSTAEYSAVPITRQLIEYLIQKFQIPPDY